MARDQIARSRRVAADVMAELTDRIIGQWTQPELWDYSTWLDLTQAGRAAAEQARGQ